ncbi:hypothetical protein [Roseospira visakhapatnamensis]|uniref:Phosphohydrolase n=1 Tax=Roseospira visakhapatnamensis TaxID=390880 RepID=A0A7W6WB52_9PROT|nr:hypothetical protein [Roseospira visakhapatnamensis]MBB4267694.1 hypothetical protein [Roseospira visakhapatnamensis]
MTCLALSSFSASRRAGEWLQLASGRRWWPLAPRVEDVCWRDIADGLGKIARFGGATQAAPYSVAQHCCHVAALLPPDLRLYGLLHDAHEALMGVDWPAPMKRSAPADVQAWLNRIADTTDAVLWIAAGVPMPSAETLRAVHQADMVALATERRDLLVPCGVDWVQELPPPDTTILRPEPWYQAADHWLTMLRSLLPADAPVPA